MKYVMLICGEESSWYDQPDSEADAAMAEIGAWMGKVEADGHLASGGYELDSSRKAKSVTRGPDGAPLVYDGPYLELKEVIGGFIVLIADDIDQAVAIASGWPGIARFGDRVEVRPVMVREEG
jgi:hypothetical protein